MLALYNEGINRIKVLEIFSKHQADFNLRDLNGRPVLFYACETEDPKIVKLFLDHGADPNSKNQFGYTILNFCSKKTEIKELLLAYGAKN